MKGNLTDEKSEVFKLLT